MYQLVSASCHDSHARADRSYDKPSLSDIQEKENTLKSMGPSSWSTKAQELMLSDSWFIDKILE